MRAAVPDGGRRIVEQTDRAKRVMIVDHADGDNNARRKKIAEIAENLHAHVKGSLQPGLVCKKRFTLEITAGGLVVCIVHAFGIGGAMVKRMGLVLCFLSVIFTGSAAVCGRIGEVYPASQWLRYAVPEQAGWSSARLDSAEALWRTIDSAAFMVIHDGTVLVSWGDVTRRFMCHSVRKSLLSALYGIHVHAGAIDLEKTLADMGIDDEPPLTPVEKRAQIADLLKARSGVYHPAAYESPGMKARRPARGSREPGTFWYYNNWDFNALCTIFECETGTSMFEEFKVRIADPLGMEDFRLIDTYYHLERQHSRHPAYPFKMSARDMARFGLLYARNGRWGDTRILPEDWVRDSARPYSSVPGRAGIGYGYMWWVITDPTDKKSGMFMARGVGEQTIAVLPGPDLVFVNRANTYLGHGTDRDGLWALMDKIIDARVLEADPDPERIPLDAAVYSPSRPAAPLALESYVATYRLDHEEVMVESIPFVVGDMIGATVEVTTDGPNLLVTDNLGQRQILLPLADGRFELEDARIPVRFEFGPSGAASGITIDGSPAWKVSGSVVRPD
jgi:CubicO group peptidase (beta-lactamase class C family)